MEDQIGQINPLLVHRTVGIVLAYLNCHEYIMIQNFGETVHTKNWLIIFWRMFKITKMPKIIIKCRLITSQLES